MNPQTKVDYHAIAQSAKFRQLIHVKKRFIIPMTIFFLVFYLALPILTSYTKLLKNSAFGDISWAWVFAFSQFIMTWVLCMIYRSKAKKFDKMVQEIESEEKGMAS